MIKLFGEVRASARVVEETVNVAKKVLENQEKMFKAL